MAIPGHDGRQAASWLASRWWAAPGCSHTESCTYHARRLAADYSSIGSTVDIDWHRCYPGDLSARYWHETSAKNLLQLPVMDDSYEVKTSFSMVNIIELTSSENASLEVFCSADVRYANNFVPPLGDWGYHTSTESPLALLYNDNSVPGFWKLPVVVGCEFWSSSNTNYGFYLVKFLSLKVLNVEFSFCWLQLNLKSSGWTTMMFGILKIWVGQQRVMVLSFAVTGRSTNFARRWIVIPWRNLTEWNIDLWKTHGFPLKIRDFHIYY